MKQTKYTTREEIVKLLAKKGFIEAEASNKNMAIYYCDNGRIIFRISPAGRVEINSDGRTVAQFKQSIFNVYVYPHQLVLMTGSDENDDYMNIYIPRREVK